MYTFSIPSIRRNAADTDVPMIEPTLLKAPKRALMAEAVAATRIVVIVTMLGVGGQK